MKNVVVLMKQVPDVRIAGEDVLLPDGSINRAILPAIVNPNDFYALQQALLIKDKYPQVTITVMSMGPMQAAEVVREGLFRGVDTGVLLCDKVSVYEMPSYTTVEIDEPDDWLILEALMFKYKAYYPHLRKAREESDK